MISSTSMLRHWTVRNHGLTWPIKLRCLAAMLEHIGFRMPPTDPTPEVGTHQYVYETISARALRAKLSASCARSDVLQLKCCRLDWHLPY